MKITEEMFKKPHIYKYFDRNGLCKTCSGDVGHHYSKHDYIIDHKGKWLTCLEEGCACGN